MAALTKKDKKLIYFCAIFTVASLLYMLLIAPKMNRLKDLKSDYIDASAAAYDISFKLSEYEISKIYLEEASERFNGEVKGFCEMKEVEEIDEFISQSARRMGLVPQSLAVSQESLAKEMTPYLNEESSDEGDESNSVSFSSDFIYEREGSITVNGTMAGILEYIDLINSTDGFMTTAVDFSSGVSSIKADSVNMTGMVSFMVYRYDKEGAEEYISSYSSYENVYDYDSENGQYDEYSEE